MTKQEREHWATVAVCGGVLAAGAVAWVLIAWVVWTAWSWVTS